MLHLEDSESAALLMSLLLRTWASCKDQGVEQGREAPVVADGLLATCSMLWGVQAAKSHSTGRMHTDALKSTRHSKLGKRWLRFAVCVVVGPAMCSHVYGHLHEGDWTAACSAW